jgi:hypothetical protein
LLIAIALVFLRRVAHETARVDDPATRVLGVYLWDESDRTTASPVVCLGGGPGWREPGATSAVPAAPTPAGYASTRSNR